MGNATIFHIDDDDDDIFFFAAAIEHISASAKCFSFTNAAKAIQQLKTGDMLPDTIFLDINMPVINGQEFLTALKATASLQHIPVIILSTSSDSHAMQQLKEDGASGFLTKPSSVKELVNLLRPYLI